MIPIFKPSCTDRELAAVTRVLQSGWWGSGPEVTKFEDEFCTKFGLNHAIAMNSCTAALHVAGKLLVLPHGCEIITTPITFISTAYLAMYNDYRVVFADVDPETININPQNIKDKITDKTKAVIVMHYGGYACDMDTIIKLCRDHNLILIEDCAHASGGKYNGKYLGSFGFMSCFSFHAVKNMSTGDGGMLVVNDQALADRAKALRWVGINKDTRSRVSSNYKWQYDVTELGYKYQMTDMAASIGRVQLDRLDSMNSRRKGITNTYNEAFASLNWLSTPKCLPYMEPSYHNYCVKVDQKIRDHLMDHLSRNDISSGVHYEPIYKHEAICDNGTIDAQCPNAEKLWKEIVLLPIFPDLCDNDLYRIIDAVTRFKC